MMIQEILRGEDMILHGWPFEPMNGSSQLDGPPYDGGGGGTPT
jgi:hypothetical protein